MLLIQVVHGHLGAFTVLLHLVIVETLLTIIYCVTESTRPGEFFESVINLFVLRLLLTFFDLVTILIGFRFFYVVPGIIVSLAILLLYIVELILK